MTIGKRKGATAKGAGDSSGNSDRFGGSLSKNDHWYIQEAFGLGVDPGAAPSTPAPVGHEASGGIVSDWVDPSPGKVYRTHVYTSSGTFVISELSGTFPANIDYLVVAGGGGGGGRMGQSGGGGAGGFRTNLPGHPVEAAAYPVSETSYTVTVGAGGVGGPMVDKKWGTNGNPSEFYPTPQSYPHASRVRSVGGGGGASYDSVPQPLMDGGSGGGAICSPTPYSGGTGNTPDPNHPQVQGYAGGDSSGPNESPYAGAGGGGAGRLGAPDNPTTPLTRSTGGYGLQALIAGPAGTIGAPGPNPANGYFAGGGGGGRYNGTSAAGGYGGGGDGAPPSPSRGNPGTTSTGGGGGGGGHPYLEGGHGGSGIVAIRYQIGTTAPEAKATGGLISTYNDKWIHTFVNSGTFATGPTWTSATVEYVVVGGGGGGGGHIQSGGGGAGGYRTGTTPIGAHPVSTTITIGAGGLGGEVNPVYATGNNGSASVFGSPIPAAGGGGGGVYPTNNAHSGASGGGSGGASSPVTGGAATGDPFPGTIGATPANGWGHPGGDGLGLPAAPAYGPAGGGGAGAAGSNGSSTVTTAGKGGAGIQLPATFRDPVSGVGAPGPTSAPTPNGFDTSGKYWVAGGGGGTAYNPVSGSALGADGAPGGASPGSNTPYAGGGGGAGDNSGYTPAGGRGAPGWANTGGGGGGAERLGPGNGGGNGGSGIVIIAYPT